MERLRLTCDDVRELAPAYVLGALSGADSEAVRDHLAACPHPHEEMSELGEVVPYLAETVEPVEPSPDLRARILAAAATTPQLAAAPSPAAPVDARDVPAPRPRSVDAAAPRTARRTAPLAWAFGLAAVFAIVALGGWGLTLQGELSQARTFRAAVADVLDVAARPGSQAAILGPAEPGGPAGLAAIAGDGSAVLAVEGLSATQGSQVYETWFIGSTGTPVAVGGFAVDRDGVARFTTRPGPVEPGVTVALTLEPAPGATEPGGPVVVSGVATAPSS